MHITKYKVKIDLEVLDVLFLKDGIIYITESFHVMNGRFAYARKVFDANKKYLGMIRDEYFENSINKRVETIYN